MAHNAKVILPLSFDQVFQLVQQLPEKDKQRLLRLLQKDGVSDVERSLTKKPAGETVNKDWPIDEDDTWKDLW